MNSQVKNIVITGGSSGIGYALAQEYAKRGFQLFLIARDMQKLNNAKNELEKNYSGCSVKIFSADVTNENELKNVSALIEQQISSLDILICNAGVLRCGRFESHSPSEAKKSFDINYWGMHQTLYCFLPLLKKSKDSKLAFVSSVAGYTGLFGYSHYAPSKFAIAGLAECLRMELKDYGIDVTVIYPPDTETPLLDYERENTLPECKALSKGAKSITAERAASVIVKGIERKKFEIYFNTESKFIRVLKGISPRMYYRIVDGIVRKSRKK